jgi:hypothetical protein
VLQSGPLSKLTVCDTLSVLVHVIMPPAATVAGLGLKVLSAIVAAVPLPEALHVIAATPEGAAVGAPLGAVVGAPLGVPVPPPQPPSAASAKIATAITETRTCTAISSNFSDRQAFLNSTMGTVIKRERIAKRVPKPTGP